MIVELDLSDEQQRLLQQMADEKGLAIGGLVSFFVEAVLAPAPSKMTGLASRLRARKDPSSNTLQRADQTIRKMRAELFVRKEEAVEAVATANMLQRVISRLRLTVSEREVQALQALRDGRTGEAHRAYQESVIYAENLQRTQPILEQAAKRADELMEIFKREEDKLRARESHATDRSRQVIEAAYGQGAISPALMESRIKAFAPESRWLTMFHEWTRQQASPCEMEAEVESPT